MRGQFRLKEGYTARMPVSLRNYPFNPDVRVHYSDCRVLSVNQKTDENKLAELIPEEFEILEPTVVWQYTNCRGVDFMMNGEYRIFQASVPVKFIGAKEEIAGSYPLIIFENNAVPVLGGREEDGMPKVVCDISLDRHFENHWFAALANYCETIARIDFWEDSELSPQAVAELAKNGKVNSFGNRWLPAIDSPAASYHDYILYPQEFYPKRIFSGKGKVDVLPPAQWYIQPAFSGILSLLAGLPNLGFSDALRIECELKLCVADSKIIKSF